MTVRFLNIHFTVDYNLEDLFSFDDQEEGNVVPDQLEGHPDDMDMSDLETPIPESLSPHLLSSDRRFTQGTEPTPEPEDTIHNPSWLEECICELLLLAI